MNSHMVCFKVELADIPFEVRCRYHETGEWFKDYFTDKEPQFTIDISDSDYIAIQEMLFQYWDKQPDPVAAFGNVEKEICVEAGTVCWMINKKLSLYGVFHLHSSAIFLDGEAYLFTAPSGTGKSTHTRLWREAFGKRTWMINDDMPYIRVFEGGAWAYGSPWMGKHRYGCNGSAPIKAIAWLTRGDENGIEPLAKPDAFPVIMMETVALQEKEWVARLMEQVKTLLDMVPFYRLRCNMDQEAAYVSMRGMKLGEFR